MNWFAFLLFWGLTSRLAAALFRFFSLDGLRLRYTDWDGGNGQIRVMEERVKRAKIDWVRLLTRLYCDHY